MNEPTILLDAEAEDDDRKEVATTSMAMQQSSIGGIDVNALLSKAIDKDTPVETMEKLLAMARQLKADYAKEQFNIALSEFQANCPEIKKTKKVSFQSKRGGNVKYQYAPIEDIVGQVKKYLVEYGFSYTIKTEQTKESFTAICEVRHINGHVEKTPFIVPIDLGASMGSAQQVGAASTYAKRYAFCNAFGIMTGDEDNDANGCDDNNSGGNRQQYPQSPKGNRMPKLSVEQAKEGVLEMIDNDQKGLKNLTPEYCERTINRVNGSATPKGGWVKFHNDLKLELEKKDFVF